MERPCSGDLLEERRKTQVRKQRRETTTAREDDRGTRFLGSWSLPSGNSADVYLDVRGLRLLWDVPPSDDWSVADRRHWKRVTYPAIVAAVGQATGQPVLCVWDTAAIH